MNQLSRLTAVALAVIATGFLSEVNAESFKEEFPIGKTFEGSVRGPFTSAPLPQGKWEVAGVYSERDVNLNLEFGHVYLAKIVDGKLFGLVSLYTNTSRAPNGFILGTQCMRKDVILIETKSNYQHDQRCAWINHHVQRKAAGEKEFAYAETLSTLRAKNIEPAEVLIAVGYRFANRGNLENLTYYFNPETQNFPTASATTWSNSDWHRDRYLSDPKKVAFIEELKGFLSTTEPKAYAGFSGN